MGIFVRAVVTGFGFSLGSALFKQVSSRLGLDDKSTTKTDPDVADDGEIGDRDARQDD
jgi:hypothetical protein